MLSNSYKNFYHNDTEDKESFLIYANNFTDHTVFISGWLKKLYLRYKEFSNSSIHFNFDLGNTQKNISLGYEITL